MASFVVQKLIRSHQITPDGRLGTWRTVTLPTSEDEALKQLLRMPNRTQHRVLSSPSPAEMRLDNEVKEWTR
jgi:hypothetical protein